MVYESWYCVLVKEGIDSWWVWKRSMGRLVQKLPTQHLIEFPWYSELILGARFHPLGTFLTWATTRFWRWMWKILCCLDFDRSERFCYCFGGLEFEFWWVNFFGWYIFGALLRMVVKISRLRDFESTEAGLGSNFVFFRWLKCRMLLEASLIRGCGWFWVSFSRLGNFCSGFGRFW